MESNLVVEHDRLRATLSGRQPRPSAWVIAVGLVMGAAIAALWGTATFGLAAVAAVPLALLLSPPARTELTCDGRTISIGGRSMSLLDVYCVFVADGWLVVQPNPGPLFPVRIDARYTPGADLERLVELLNQAVAQAEPRRGDRPDDRHHAVARIARAGALGIGRDREREPQR